MMANGQQPRLVLVFCGKRKSGKDYVVSKVQTNLGDLCEVFRVSAPLKEQYAKEHGLDYKRLLDSSSYKEQYRVEMMKWGEEVRSKDPGYFCRLAVQKATKPVWIICDARRLTDMEFFSNYNMLSVRVHATDEVRRSRGWEFVGSVDDGESECGLDEYNCDVLISNNGEDEQLMADIKKLKDLVIRELKI